jgi:hypothetical protein
MTAHDNIDNLLAADLHGELSDTERSELQNHLLDCAICRQAHQETKIMNQLLEEKLEKPDPAFEQRMLGAFRNRVPKKQRSIPNLIAGFMRLRSAQIAGVTAILLALVQIGRVVTGDYAGRHQFANGGNNESIGGAILKLPRQSLAAQNSSEGDLNFAEFGDKKATDHSRMAAADALASTAVPPPPLQPSGQPEFQEETKTRFAKTAPVKSPQTAAMPQAAVPNEDQTETSGTSERVIVTGSNIPVAEEVGPNPAETPNPALANRKLIRNATVDLEIVSFDAALQKITAFASEERGYVATTSSEKQENGKLQGEVVVKVLPENLDRFLQKIRGLGELKNQTLGTEDVTKSYFDTESRLKNARVMESRLVDMLKTKTGKVSDLLQVEKELGRVREEIEKMQGELKFWDSQVQFATVTISLSEKDMETPAAFLLKERAQLALYTPEVEKIYNDIKGLASPKVQITNAQLDRDNSGRVSARMSMLIDPEESEGVLGKVKAMGRVENFQMQTQRIAQGGEGMSENAKTKRDKVELNITVSRDEQEQALQQTNLRIRTSAVDDQTKSLRDLAVKQNGRVRSSSFSRDPNGREFANVTLRVPMKNYNALMQSLDSLGKVEDVSVQRQDRTGQDVDLASAPADLTIQIYSQGNIVSSDTGIFATLRNTIGQGAGALMWSVRMIGVAIAFLAPWVIALVAMIWIVKRIKRARR